MNPTVVLGIDPGGRASGLVLRQGPTPLAACVVTRDSTGELPTAADIAEVLGAVTDFAARVEVPPVVAVEGLHAPTPQMGLTSVTGLIGAGMVFGAVLGAWPDALVVPPGGHGSGPLGAYPEALRPTRGQGKGADRLRHARSAWDVAGAALVIRRSTEALRERAKGAA